MVPAAAGQTLLSAPIHDELCRVLERVVRDVDGTAHATLVLTRSGEWSTVMHSHPAAEALTEIDRRAGGPICSVIDSGRVSRISSTARHRACPEYTLACASHGIHSVAAFPIAADGELVGVLSLASFDHFGVGVHELKICMARAAELATILRDANVDR